MFFISSFIYQRVRRQTDFSDAGIRVVISYHRVRQGAIPPGLQHRTLYLHFFLLLTIHFCFIFSLFSFILSLKISTFSLPFFISLHFLDQMMENMILFRIQIYVKDSLIFFRKKYENVNHSSPYDILINETLAEARKFEVNLTMNQTPASVGKRCCPAVLVEAAFTSSFLTLSSIFCSITIIWTIFFLLLLHTF